MEKMFSAQTAIFIHINSLMTNVASEALWREAGLVCDAPQMLRSMIAYSDSQYCSTLYQSLLTRREFRCSMSTKEALNNSSLGN